MLPRRSCWDILPLVTCQFHRGCQIVCHSGCRSFERRTLCPIRPPSHFEVDSHSISIESYTCPSFEGETMCRISAIVLAAFFVLPLFAQEKHPFTFADMMKLKRVEEPERTG